MNHARARWRSCIEAAWRGQRLCLLALLPLAALYGALWRIRRWAYDRAWLPSAHPGGKVVVVGNVVAGGAGKTPVTLAVVEHLRRKGYSVGLISRGYGRRGIQVEEVTATSDARQVGDEPLLLHRRTGLPVFVGADRLAAAQALRQKYPQTEVIVSDDGLQHLRLRRDLEICVFDAGGLGNGRLLPAGPLREPWPRPTSDVPMLIVGPPGLNLPPLEQSVPVHRRLSDTAVNAEGQRRPLAALRTQPLVAVAGIAHPERFFEALRAQGLTLAECHAFPDHYDFDSNLAPFFAGKEIICTEKDAVKLWCWRPEAWAVALEVELPEAFFAAIDRALATAPQRAQSHYDRAHGSPPT